jgi:peptide-methionine (R)-S-oxide reductase
MESSSTEGNRMSYEVSKSDDEWRRQLTADEYAVLRQAATERPWTGELLDENRVGTYGCKACGAALFTSDAKFDSHCGWPSFYIPTEADAVRLVQDSSLGMVRTEVLCANCGSHLGHLFDDAPQTPTGDRFCMNSVSLSFSSAE